MGALSGLMPMVSVFRCQCSASELAMFQLDQCWHPKPDTWNLPFNDTWHQK